jgi:hypothetical protein
MGRSLVLATGLICTAAALMMAIADILSWSIVEAGVQ